MSSVIQPIEPPENKEEKREVKKRRGCCLGCLWSGSLFLIVCCLIIFVVGSGLAWFRNQDEEAAKSERFERPDISWQSDLMPCTYVDRGISCPYFVPGQYGSTADYDPAEGCEFQGIGWRCQLFDSLSGQGIEYDCNVLLGYGKGRVYAQVTCLNDGKNWILIAK